MLNLKNMAGKNKIEINKAKNGELFLTFKGANNKKLATSGETYKTKAGVNNAVKAISKIIKNPVIVDNTIVKKKKK